MALQEESVTVQPMMWSFKTSLLAESSTNPLQLVLKVFSLLNYMII